MAHIIPLTSPEEVMSHIPTSALRAICASDPNLCALDATSSLTLPQQNETEDSNKKSKVATRSTNKTAGRATARKESSKKPLTGREARRRIVLEVERQAVRVLCERVAKPRLLAAVNDLKIEAGLGNNPTSRSVAAKRLSEYICVVHGGVGLATFLEKEVAKELVSDLASALSEDELKSRSTREAAVQASLEQAALVAFFESLPEEQLHNICFAMKNERAQGETKSRQFLAASIIANQPVAELVEETKSAAVPKAARAAVKLSKKKPKLREGVTYEDVFQWYNLSELQEFAREHQLKVSGKKKEVINRILTFLATGTAPATKKPQRKKASSNKNEKEKESDEAASEPEPKRAAARPIQLNPKLASLLKRITKASKLVLPGLSPEQIEEREEELSRTLGVRIKLPDALRQVYMHCNGFSNCLAEFTDSCGFTLFPFIITPDVPNPKSCQLVIDSDGLLGGRDEWMDSHKKEGGKPEECVAWPTWLPLGCGTEYHFFFINADPEAASYGHVFSCVINEGCGDKLWTESLEKLLEQDDKYLAKAEKVRQDLRKEEPDLDPEELEDLVYDDLEFGDDEEEEEEGEEKDEEEDEGEDDEKEMDE